MKKHVMKDGTVYYTDPRGRMTFESEMWGWSHTAWLAGIILIGGCGIPALLVWIL